MRQRIFFLLSLNLLWSGLTHAACISPDQAVRHVGETKCVSGTVTRIVQRSDGAHFLEFCGKDGTSCPFAAVVFSEDLRHIGDVRQLQGKVVEVHGEVNEYDGRPQIVVSESWQLKGEASSIPPLPKAYDVEKKGHHSSGIFSHPKTYSTTKKRQTAKMPIIIPDDPPE